MNKMCSNPEIIKISERRLKPRVECDYPARILCHDEDGKVFRVEGRAVNLSRNGVYILLNREIPVGMELSIRIVFPNGLHKQGTAKLAVDGTVVRSEFHSEKIFGIAVQFQDYRFV